MAKTGLFFSTLNPTSSNSFLDFQTFSRSFLWYKTANKLVPLRFFQFFCLGPALPDNGAQCVSWYLRNCGKIICEVWTPAFFGWRQIGPLTIVLGNKCTLEKDPRSDINSAQWKYSPTQNKAKQKTIQDAFSWWHSLWMDVCITKSHLCTHRSGRILGRYMYTVHCTVKGADAVS